MEPNFTLAKQWTNKDVDYDDIDLTNANVKPLEIGLAGRQIFVSLEAWDSEYVISTTKSTGKAIATLNEPNGRPFELSAGMYYNFGNTSAFDRLFIRNAAQASKMLRIVTAVDTLIQPFSGEIQIVGDVGTDSVVDEADNDIATTVTLAFVANSSLKERIIFNDSAVDIKFLGSNAAGTNGPIIGPGENIRVSSQNAIYLLSTSGTIPKAQINAINILS